MKQKLLLLFALFNFSVACAQSIKTDVVVVGAGSAGMAAALQCARSKVKTVWVLPAEKLADPLTGIVTITANNNLPSGIWGELRSRMRDLYKGKTGFDTTFSAPLQLNNADMETVFKAMTDTVKNLTIYLNSPFVNIKKDGDRWEVIISQNGKTNYLKARAVIDATINGDVALKAGAKLNPVFDNAKVTAENMYRTSIVAGESLPGQFKSDAGKASYPEYPAFCLPLNLLLLKTVDNIWATGKVFLSGADGRYLPLQLQLGQGIGTIAAFCAFFKTTTAHLNVRAIQGELLDYKGYLIPFADITNRDRDWRATQQIGATGLLKGRQIGSIFSFMPDSTVKTAEVKPVLTEVYTRAFLWFNKEKPGDKFTVGNLLSLISDYSLTDPQLLQSSIQKNWKPQYKFKLDFDLNRPITRREFAVLANRYLNPFARTVDLSGRLIN